MVEKPLVDEEVAAAKRLVGFLDGHGMPVKAALWLYESDAERWRFVISFDEMRADVGSFYLDVARLIHAEGRRDDLLPLDRVSFVDADRSVVGRLAVGMKGRKTEGRRLIDERVDDIFVEDALILRLPA